MSLTRFHEIESTEPEDIRAAMIAYHQEQTERYETLISHSRLMRELRENRAKREVHESMIEFWKTVVFKPKKKE